MTEIACIIADNVGNKLFIKELRGGQRKIVSQIQIHL
jgi:hypothetical protein